MMPEKERLIKELENYEPYAVHFPHLTVDGKLILDVLRLLREQPQWISVKDRLPDDASDVLAYYDDGTESRIIPVNYYKGCWYDCVFNRAIDGLETGFIKYWMSLPKAPEVKQNETD